MAVHLLPRFLVGTNSETGAGVSTETRAEHSPRRWEEPTQPHLLLLPPAGLWGHSARSRWGPRSPCRGAWPELQGRLPFTPTARSGPGPPWTPSPSRPKAGQDRAVLFLLEEGAAREPTGWGKPGLDEAAGGRASPVYVPAEEVVLHQHVLNTLLQWLLLLLHTGTASACAAGVREPTAREPKGAGGQRGSGTIGCRHSGSAPPGPASATHLGSGVIGHETPGLPRPRQTPQGDGGLGGREATPSAHTSLFTGSSQSWERLKAKQQRTLEEGSGEAVGGAQVSSAPTSPTPEHGAGAPAAWQGTHRSSHLIWTQPGLRRKDQGWYHFSTVGRLEHSTSSHRCNTCSLGTGQEWAAPPAPALPSPLRHLSGPRLPSQPGLCRGGGSGFGPLEDSWARCPHGPPYPPTPVPLGPHPSSFL